MPILVPGKYRNKLFFQNKCLHTGSNNIKFNNSQTNASNRKHLRNSKAFTPENSEEMFPQNFTSSYAYSRL